MNVLPAMRVTVVQIIMALLAHIHTEDDEHGKQGQGKEKCHVNSVYSSPSYNELVKNHLRSS